MTVQQITHPDYDAQVDNWSKFRLTFAGGTDFIEEYLKKMSARETVTDFNNRKEISYCPAHAKVALINIKNAIYQRMVDIVRDGGPQSYRDTVSGLNGGVDLRGNSMDAFMGVEILPELLSMAKVGIYVDKPPMGATTLNNAVKVRPYIYKYNAEDIRSWRIENNQLTSLLLRDNIETFDEETSLVTGTSVQFRLLTLTQSGVTVKMFDKDGVDLGTGTTLTLKRIPFVVAEITQSLLTDVADYQIALLNLASSDINYAFRSNYPFYTEQFDQRTDMARIKQVLNVGKDGTAEAASIQADPEISVGVSQGRRYPMTADRPGFIHPSSEPLIASMKKQQDMKDEILMLMNLTLSVISSSAESKQEDDKGLESGLSYIGLELEHVERVVGELWAMYESGDAPLIKYPTKYSLKTDAERRDEANDLEQLATKVPSVTYQKTVMKQVATVTVGTKVSLTVLQQIHTEIDTATITTTDPSIIIEDHDAGLVSTQTASSIRGYPDGEVEQAKKDHADRAARIARAQSTATNQARGVDDLGDAGEGAAEKGAVDELDPNRDDNTRGEGK